MLELELPEEYRTYRLVKITGWTLDQIDAAPAERCDWLLAIDDEVEAAAAARRRKEMQLILQGRR